MCKLLARASQNSEKKSLRPGKHLRSSEPKNEEPPHLRSSIFGPEDRSEDRTEDGGDFFEDGGGSSKMGGFLGLPAPKNEEPPIFDLRSRKNEEPPPHLPPSRPEERRTPPLLLFLPTPSSDQYSPGPLSSPDMLSGRVPLANLFELTYLCLYISIFSPIFHLENRSENRDRPSTT